jgi:hypothetical protein
MIATMVSLVEPRPIVSPCQATLSRSAQDEDWPAWYAAYMVAEQAGTDLPS